MFAFTIWGKFASFKDPFTISQNITLLIPPKTTIGGILASFLGLPYQSDRDNIAYYDDEDFFDFKYSCVILNPIIKKSFSQNYINDYTKTFSTKLENLKKGKATPFKVSPKPINRELLLNPKYLIFIKDFKYEKKVAELIKTRETIYPLYLGNSEFAGNYKYIELLSKQKKKEDTELDSFMLQQDSKKILFTENTIYSQSRFATKTTKDRSYQDYQNVILSDGKIGARDIEFYEIKTKNNIYNCQFL